MTMTEISGRSKQLQMTRDLVDLAFRRRTNSKHSSGAAGDLRTTSIVDDLSAES